MSAIIPPSGGGFRIPGADLVPAQGGVPVVVSTLRRGFPVLMVVHVPARAISRVRMVATVAQCRRVA